MPSKPMLPTTGGVSALAVRAEHHARAAEAGQRAGDDHDQDVRPADAHAGGPGGVRVGADRAQLEAERRPVEQPGDRPRWPAPPSMMPSVDPQARRRAAGAAGPTASTGLADRVRAVRVLDAVLQDEPGRKQQRDVVEHDRGDDLVGAGPGLEDAGDEAPDRAAEQRRRAARRAGAAPAAAAAGSRPARPATTPMIAWPWAPMLNRPPRKASATDRPVKTSGAA